MLAKTEKGEGRSFRRARKGRELTLRLIRLIRSHRRGSAAVKLRFDSVADQRDADTAAEVAQYGLPPKLVRPLLYLGINFGPKERDSLGICKQLLEEIHQLSKEDKLSTFVIAVFV
jgi:hypothetical protein